MLSALARTWTLIVKELLIIIRDRASRQMLIAPPLIQLILFSSAATLEVKSIRLMILDLDAGRHGTEIVRRIGASTQFESVVMADSSQAMIEALERREILFFVTIPADFSRRIIDGRGASLGVVYDGRRSNAAQVVDGYLGEIVNRYRVELGDPSAAPLSVVERHWFNPNLDHRWTTIPSLVGILTLVMAMSFSALSLAREKEMGTFEQLLVTPFRPFEIIVGKLVPFALIGVLDSHIVFVFGQILFGVPFLGSYPVLLGAVILYSFSIVGFGLMISSIARTQQQAILGAFMFMVPAIALSGFAAPLENMPGWLERAMWLNPMRHAVIIFKGLFLKDMPADLVLANAWPLAVIGTASLLLAGWMFRRHAS
jgi:ABC-2 type transport system permease protein